RDSRDDFGAFSSLMSLKSLPSLGADFSEPQAEAEPDAAGRQDVVLGVAQLALRHRRPGVAQVLARQPHVPSVMAIAEAGGPGGVGRGERRVALVEEAVA